MFSLLFSCLLLSGDLHIGTTDIFQRMDVSEIAVRDDGAVYILNFEEARIQYYGPDGKLIKNIGGKGKGPGEFTFPVYFRYTDDHLFIHDVLTDKISVFDKEGTFLKQISPPMRNLRFARGNGGWFYWTIEEGHSLGGALYFTRDGFETKKELFKLPDAGWFSQGMSINNNNGEISGSFSPLSLEPMLAASPDGEVIYFVPDPRKLEVMVLDGNSGKVLTTFTKDARPVPFDSEWADETFQRNATFLKQQGISQSKIKKNYPTHFPIIRQVRSDANGNLIVNRWRGRPDDNDYTVCFDRKGGEVEDPFSFRDQQRIAGMAGGFGYVVVFDGDEAGLAKVPAKDVKTYLDNNPIEDWDRSRSISISR